MRQSDSPESVRIAVMSVMVLALDRLTEYFCEGIVVHRGTLGDQLPIAHEIDDIPAGLLPCVERSEAQEGLDRHVGREPVPVGQLGLVPEGLLLGPDAVNRLDQTAGEQVGEAPDHLVDGSVQGREADTECLHLVLGRCSVSAGLHLAVDHLTVHEVLVGDHERIANIVRAVAEYRDNPGDQALLLHLVGRPHLAADALPHGVLDGQHGGQEVSGATVRS